VFLFVWAGFEANLQGANLFQANFQDAKLEDANLQGANLSQANFQNAKLRNANLRGANVREANFQGAYLGATRLTEEQIYSVKTLYKAELDPWLKEKIEKERPDLLEKPTDKK
jgi:uncharacterized protein YjbI with pentapeptide repeats